MNESDTELARYLNREVLRIGTAGWSIPKNCRSDFPEEGTGLEKYAARFNVVEINSSFYRPHKISTYEKWASQVAENFSFSVKLPRSITHQSRLTNIDEQLAAFAEQISGLGTKLGCVLVQLPPSFEFFQPQMKLAFGLLRQTLTCPIVCEPRHESWFSNAANQFLMEAGLARVAADPALFASAAQPGGDTSVCYYRLHGSPDMYYSEYSTNDLHNFAGLIRGNRPNSKVWCIFDNTANGYATSNAIAISRLLAT
jgi:uncharacterized protein YecE (DUF72 family)